MRPELLDKLQCPFTGGSLAVREVLAGSASDVRFGILSGEGGDFPIVDGIPRLQSDELRHPILEAITRRQFTQALRIAIDWPYHDKLTALLTEAVRTAYKGGAAPLARLLMRAKGSLHSTLVGEQASFCDLVEKVGGRHWAEWQKYRFSMATFLPVYPLLQVMKTDGYVLDFASGVGHMAFLLAQDAPQEKIVCADKSFSCLYIARKYFVPRASFVSLDGNMPLPFVSGVFSRAVCSDALHFIPSKMLAARELMRVVAPRGAVVLAHLHNRLSPIRSGSALSPAGYRSLFNGVRTQIVPEASLIASYLKKGELDLERLWSDDELNASVDGLSMVVSDDETIFRRYTGLLDASVNPRRNAVINPIYRIIRSGQDWVLTKNVSKTYREIVEARIRNYAAEKFILSAGDSIDPTTGRVQTASRDRLYQLARQFVVIEAPERYASPVIQ